jgi:hypothetical protein
MKPDVAFRIGDRVRLSKLGRTSFAKTPDRRGTIVRVGGTQTRYRVQWDGQATAEYIYWTYLEFDGAPGAR